MQTFDLKRFRRKHNLTQEQIADILGYKQGFISSIEKGIRPFPKEKLPAIENEFGDISAYICEGEMLSCGVSSVGKSPSVSGRTIRYWADINATGGGNEIFTDSDTARIIKLEIPEFRDCTDAVNIYGDSMSPIYKSGQIILLRKWEESYIEYGCAYLITTKGGHRMVKILDKSESEENVTCISANPKFSPFEVKKEDIISLWLVKGSICKSNM